MLGMPTFDLTSERGKQDFQKWITFAIKNEINSYSRQVLNIDNTGAGGGGGSPTGPAGGGLTGEYPDPLIYPDMTGITSISTPQIISFNTINPGVAAIGALVWNDTNGTLEFGLKGGNVNLSIGQENVALVKHADNSGLVKGKVVYVAGSDGSNKTVRYALATSDATSARTFGVMAESATGGNKAFVATQGIVSDIDTSALTEGAAVYVSPSVAGDLTSTKPSAPDHIVLVGFCVRSHAVNGVLYVTVVNGFELDELHDVKITSKQNGDIIKYNSSTGVWENVASDDIPAHASTHEFGGSDEIEIAPSQVTGTAVITSDSRLTDARTPLDASVTSPKFNIDYSSAPTVSHAGALYYNTVDSKLFVWDGSAWDEVGGASGSGVPIGTIIWTGQSTIPAGFLDCDGSSQLRSAYPDLFSVIGTTYGQGSNPGTTFALPNVSSTTGNYVICAQLSPTIYTSDALFTAPLGSMIQWPITTGFPTGWLRADGSAISRTSYADLFSIIGTTYGTGDGSTTFNLPNMFSAGTGSPVTLIKALLSGTVQPSTVAHASSHIRGGSDVIDADRAQVDYTPTYYTRNSGASGAGAVTDLTAHLSGIDTKLYNNIVAFTGERNGAPAVGQFYANGNGAVDTVMLFPFSCELIGASLRQNGAANGNITVQAFKNFAVNASYAMTSSGANGGAWVDWRSAPLAFNAGDVFAWRVSAVTSTAGGSVVTWFMRITAF